MNENESNAFENFKFKLEDIVEHVAKPVLPKPVAETVLMLTPALPELRFVVIGRSLLETPAGIERMYYISGEEPPNLFVHEIEIKLV